MQSLLLKPFNLYKAFTIIDLIFTITIVGVIGINVVPRFLQASAFNQKVFVQQVINALAYAQNLAIGTGCHIAVNTTYTNITFNLRQNCTAGAFNLSVFDPENINNAFVVTAPYNISITTINFPIYFDTNGLVNSIVTGAATNAILNINSQTISIIGNTGLISL